nr:MAG TPA: hypothetical protein [Crassvirales sp.]
MSKLFLIMSDTVEKIYCTDNNDALLASVMGKQC